MSRFVAFLFATGLVTALSAAAGQAQDEGSAMQQLQDAAQDGQSAVQAPTDEEAKEESNETFDTPHDSDGD